MMSDQAPSSSRLLSREASAGLPAKGSECMTGQVSCEPQKAVLFSWQREGALGVGGQR